MEENNNINDFEEIEQNSVPKKRVLLATGIPMLESELKSSGSVEIVGQCLLKSEIMTEVLTNGPDILLVSDSIGGKDDLIPLLVNTKSTFRDLRVIYFTNSLRPAEDDRKDALGMLVIVGIYDIIMEDQLNLDMVIDIIENPKRKEAVDFLTSRILNTRAEILNAISGLEYRSYIENAEIEEKADPKILASLSFKPGTGKSHFSSNLGVCIAKYAAETKHVCLIEADLQTLSLGTIFNIKEDPNRNLAVAMGCISSILELEQTPGHDEEILKQKKKLGNCFIKANGISNLDLLVGSSLTPEEVDALAIKADFYSYLVDFASERYDYVIIDLNSSILQKSTLGVLRKCATCYYILNLDINNVRNNIRYKSVITRMGIEDKVKYILNENIENGSEFYEYSGTILEDLLFTAKDLEKNGFVLTGKIPHLPKTVFLNRLFDGTPVVLDRDSIAYTNLAKLSFLEIANEITPMGPELEKLKSKLQKKKKISLLDAFRKPAPDVEDDDGSVEDDTQYGGRFSIYLEPGLHEEIYKEAENKGISFSEALQERLQG